MQEVVRYPNQMAQSINQQYCGATYPALVLPCNRLHLKLGGCSTKPGRVLNVLALPEEFPLALSFAHCLSLAAAQQPTLQQQMIQALSICLQSLSKFLNRINCLLPLKEVVLHQLSAITWTLCAKVDPAQLQLGAGQEEERPTLYMFPSKFLQSIQQELLKLYESESGKFTKSKSSDSKFAFPPPESIGAGGLGRFSTYFQTLLEFVLAALDYQQKFHGVPLTTSNSSSSATLVSSSCASTVGSSNTLADDTSSTSESSTSTVKPGPSTVGGSTSAAQVSSVPPTSSVNSSKTEAPQSATPTSCAAPVMATATDPSVGKKLTKRTRSRKGLVKKDASDSAPKKDEWLNIVRQSTSLLKAVTSPASSCVISPPTSTSSPTHPSSRLVVLNGLPSELSLEAVELVIKKVCKLYGGLYMEQLYLPSQDGEPTKHCGHAVLELCCGVHTSTACSNLLGSPTLRQDSSHLQALAVTNTLHCGLQETEGNKVLVDYLRWRLGVGEQTAAQVLTQLFNSSCSEGASALTVAQVSGELLKFFSSFADLCAVSPESFMEDLWKEFGKEGALDLEGFLTCFEKNFMVNDEYSARGVWLGLIDCGYDFHLQRFVCMLCLHVTHMYCTYRIMFLFHTCIDFHVMHIAYMLHTCACMLHACVTCAGIVCTTSHMKSVRTVCSRLLRTRLWYDMSTTCADICQSPLALSNPGIFISQRQQLPVNSSQLYKVGGVDSWWCVVLCLTPLPPHPITFPPLPHPLSSLPPSLPHPLSLPPSSPISLLTPSPSLPPSFRPPSLPPPSPSPFPPSPPSVSTGFSLLEIRHRFFQLKLINHQLSLLLPLIDLRSPHPLSLGQLLSSISPLLFSDIKISFFHSVLNASTRRSMDQAPPEIKMDPLESVGDMSTDPLKTHFCQAAQQMLSVPSAQLCVSLASGGDPTYAFNVKLAGEEVHGTSKLLYQVPYISEVVCFECWLTFQL